MKDRFPRTPAEFDEHGRIVVLRCDCGATTVSIRPENLIQRLGQDFDLCAGFPELAEAFPCEACGRRQHPSFFDTRRAGYGAVSLEEATTTALELSAFALARDAAALGITQEELLRRRRTQTLGRWRKFGKR
jgi:hypothetical protein